MERKKIAIILFGYHYIERIICSNFKNGRTVDYTVSLNNYKKYIFNYFTSLGYDIDVFISSYNSIKEKDLIRDYNPVEYKLTELITDRKKRRVCCNDRIIDGISMCESYSKKNNMSYSNVLLTRFDLYFMIDFNKANFNFKKFQIVSFLDNKDDRGMDDNLYFFPFEYISIFRNILIENKLSYTKAGRHFYFNLITPYIEIDTIYNENRAVGGLNFFKIVRIDSETREVYVSMPGKVVSIKDIIKI